MRRAYWLLLLFGLWCIVSGIWYIEAVKGINTDPNFFNPHVRWMAIIEILLMLLVSCLIGYGIGWRLRDNVVLGLRQKIEDLESRQELLRADKREAEENLHLSQKDLRQMQHTHSSRMSQYKQSIDSLTQGTAELKRELDKVRATEIPSSQIQQLENETGALRFRTKQLEFQNQELTESNEKLKLELEEYHLRQSRKPPEPIHPFVRPVEMSEKDDLTMIKGIGPFIEKRLNMVGIYTLRQISEFTPEMIEHVSKAIEFFPNRITRDDWAGQAEVLLRRS